MEPIRTKSRNTHITNTKHKTKKGKPHNEANTN